MYKGGYVMPDDTAFTLWTRGYKDRVISLFGFESNPDTCLLDQLQRFSDNKHSSWWYNIRYAWNDEEPFMRFKAHDTTGFKSYYVR